MPFAEETSGPVIEFSLAPLLESHGVALALMGVFVVFIALSLVVAFITVLPRVAARIASQERTQAEGAQTFAQDELPEETIVVIAAAVAEIIRGTAEEFFATLERVAGSYLGPS